MNNPLFRFLEREVTVATKLLKKITSNSGDIQEMCAGKSLATNLLRELCKEIHSDTVPKPWVSFVIDPFTFADKLCVGLAKALLTV